MWATIHHNSKDYKINLSEPLDISIPLTGEPSNINAWYLDPPRIEPHREGSFIGKVSEGASTNFNDICFNPHSHITHTECIGHITEEFYSVNRTLAQFFFLAELVTIAPLNYKGDLVISKMQLENTLGNKNCEAVIIRTLPNTGQKLSRQYSNTNPPYLLEEAARFLADQDISHLLIDLPSVDKEKDEGALLAHKAFWDFGGNMRKQATISEFIFVDNNITDGTYFLNLQIAPFRNDASPSRPVLYAAVEE
jgi:kynurenine formamidase